MSKPIYLRRWFKIGLGFVLVGLFTWGLSVYQTGKYEAEYPELAKSMDKREAFLEQVNGKSPEPDPNAAKPSKEVLDRRQELSMLHSLYGMYRYVGWVFVGIGLFFMLLSFKEPQVPDIDSLDDDDDSNRNTV